MGPIETITFIYCPQSGSRVLGTLPVGVPVDGSEPAEPAKLCHDYLAHLSAPMAARTAIAVPWVRYANGSMHVYGVHLSWYTATSGDWWRDVACAVAEELATLLGGIAWDAQGAVHLVLSGALDPMILDGVLRLMDAAREVRSDPRCVRSAAGNALAAGRIGRARDLCGVAQVATPELWRSTGGPEGSSLALRGQNVLGWPPKRPDTWSVVAIEPRYYRQEEGQEEE